MKVFRGTNICRKDKTPIAVAIGAFDGLHRGHQAIIKKTIRKAEELNIKSGVYSFRPHPLKIIKYQEAPSLLMSYKQKEKILKKIGIDYYFEQKFTPEFSKMNFRKFIKNIILKRLNVSHIVVGHDFNFGHHGTGNTDTLKKFGKKYGFTVTILKPVTIKKKKISSSKIRELVKKGEIEKITEYLGRPYCLEGKVVYGEGRGQKLGIPTANLELATEYVLPPSGVYATYVYYRENRYKSITNFGYKPTFDGKDYSIEIHMMNFSGKLYGSRLNLELIKFIRKEIAFDSPSKLVKQIDKDILYTDSLLC